MENLAIKNEFSDNLLYAPWANTVSTILSSPNGKTIAVCATILGIAALGCITINPDAFSKLFDTVLQYETFPTA